MALSIQPASENLPPSGNGLDSALKLDIEIRFLEQEHRIFKILRNLRRHKDGVQREAVMRSLFGWLLSVVLSGGVIVGSVGITATIITWLEMRKQTDQMALQTDAVIRQNTHFQRQIDIQVEQDYQTRKALLLATIYDTEQQWPWSAEGPRASGRARAEAAASFVRLENDWALLPEHSQRRLDLSGAPIGGAVLMGTDLSGANLAEADLSGADLSGAAISTANLEGARYSDKTIWPGRFDPMDPVHGLILID